MVLAEFLTWSQSLVDSFGYLGIFVISLVGNASLFLVVPVFMFVFAAGALLNPWLIGLSAGLGATIGELTSYGIGLGAEKIIELKEKKYGKWLDRAEKWFEKHGAFPIIILFAATPLPHDIVGLLCGVLRYDVKKFLLATFIGKFVMYSVLAWSGFFGIQWILSLFGG